MRAFDFIFGASISERSCCRYLQMCELVKTDVAVSSCPTPSAGGGAGALSTPHRVSQRQGQSRRGGPQPRCSSVITSSGCCSGGANRRTGSRRVGRGPWAVGGGVWLRSPQLRVQCLLMKSYHQILFHTSKNFKIFFFTGMFRFLAAHLTAATMSRSLLKISEGPVYCF